MISVPWSCSHLSSDEEARPVPGPLAFYVNFVTCAQNTHWLWWVSLPPRVSWVDNMVSFSSKASIGSFNVVSFHLVRTCIFPLISRVLPLPQGAWFSHLLQNPRLKSHHIRLPEGGPYIVFLVSISHVFLVLSVSSEFWVTF